MRFAVANVTQAAISTVTGWRYAAPYDVYNDSATGMTGADHRLLVDSQGVICGFFAWGKAAQVHAADRLYAAEDALDVAIGLRPDLAGHGQGLFAAETAIGWLRNLAAPRAFRLAVYEWDLRAVRIYRRLGFVPLASRGGFLLMRREERPWRDATRPLENGMALYPGDPPFERRLLITAAEEGWNASAFTTPAHAGTHVDAPVHIGLHGGIESLPLDAMNGAVQVIDWRAEGIGAVRGPRVLLRLDGGALVPQEAQALVDAGARFVGVDGLSVGAGESELLVHRLLLQSGVVILENAALERFAAGWYEMRCLPLRMTGSDGAPARLLLREEGL